MENRKPTSLFFSSALCPYICEWEPADSLPVTRYSRLLFLSDALVSHKRTEWRCRGLQLYQPSASTMSSKSFWCPNWKQISMFYLIYFLHICAWEIKAPLFCFEEIMFLICQSVQSDLIHAAQKSFEDTLALNDTCCSKTSIYGSLGCL